MGFRLSPESSGCLALLLCCLLLAVDGGRLDFLRLADHDGVSRTCKLTKDNFTTVTSEPLKKTVVFFSQCDETGKCNGALEAEAEVLSQVLSSSGIRFCLASSDLKQTSEVSIYTGGRELPYYGKVSASAILSFLIKVDTNQVRVITGKLDKVAFDAVQEPKLVGLFMNGTADFLAYQEASRLFSPSVIFYAVFDRTVAKHLRLDVVGQIYLYKPLQKTPVACPVNPASVTDLQAFIQDQRGAVLTKLTEHNLNDPLLEDPERVLVLAIAEQTSPVGAYLYRLLTKTFRNNTNNTEFNRLNVLWIEPDLFPALYLNARTPVPGAPIIPSQFPCLGSLNGTSSVWFDMAQLNATADKTADEANVALITAWLEAVLTNMASTTTSGSVQSFIVQPTSQVVLEGSDFTLECRVLNPVGDCLWLHNGQNLGFNMLRYGGLYTWVVPREDAEAVGDCSLRVNGARAGGQDGQWVCEMTGNESSPTITSEAAVIAVTLKGASKSEL